MFCVGGGCGGWWAGRRARASGHAYPPKTLHSHPPTKPHHHHQQQNSGCKYRLDAAERKLLATAAYMRAHPQYCENLRAEEFREMYAQGWMRVLTGV